MPLARMPRILAFAVAYLAGYIALDWVSYLYPISPLGITPWNPAAGLTFVLLWRWGPQAIALAALAAVLSDLAIRGNPTNLAALSAGSLWIALVYALAVRLLDRLKVDSHLPELRDVIWFTALVGPATLIAAVGYVTAFVASETLSTPEWLASVLRFWIGDLNGILVTAPALLVWHWQGSGRQALRRLADAAADGTAWLVLLQALSIVAALYVTFGLPMTDEFKFFYLLFLPVTWAALHWGVPGAALTVAASQIGLISVVLLMGYQIVPFIEFQILMLALCSTGLVIGAVVSERRRARAELLAHQAALSRAEQFAAAGEMTAALAHEVNNPIAALMQYVQAGRIMADRAGPDRQGLSEVLDKALNEGRRASDVVRTLRDFYRAGQLELKVTDLAALAERVVDQLDAEAQRRGVQVRRRGGARVLAQVDPMQIFILARNLVENAIAAADRPGARTVEVAVERSGDRARLTVDDNGPGFASPPQTLPFAPFHTSKPDGMGLGLAIANRIATSHGTHLDIAAAPLGGARVSVEFPLVEADRDS
ncbi:MAG: MASE1 domain-containing protein [Steroidobacteraceae bacterium]